MLNASDLLSKVKCRYTLHLIHTENKKGNELIGSLILPKTIMTYIMTEKNSSLYTTFS